MAKNGFDSFIENTLTRDQTNPELDQALYQVYEAEIDTMKKVLNSISSSNENVDNFNIILFGPAGSGKSSFIRTLFNSYYKEYKKIWEISEKLIVKELEHNEGTKEFSEFCLKKGVISKFKS